MNSKYRVLDFFFSVEENTSAGIVKIIEEVDAFIDGHNHKVYSQYKPYKYSNNVVLAQTGIKLDNIWILIMHENDTISHQNINKVLYKSENIESEAFNVTRKKKVYYVDKEMNEYINKIFKSFSDELNKVIDLLLFLWLISMT